MTWNLLKNEAYQDAKLKGFHNEELSDEHCIVLIMTELAEAVEADRKNKHADREQYKALIEYADRERMLTGDILKQYEKEAFENLIKDTVEDELADVVIRVLDLSGLRNVDLESVDEMKDFEYHFDCPEIMEDFAENRFTEVIFDLSQMLFRCYYNPYEGLNHRRLRIFLCYVLYYCKHHNIDIEWHVDHKMEYNQYRERKHGKIY